MNHLIRVEQIKNLSTPHESLSFFAPSTSHNEAAKGDNKGQGTCRNGD